MYNPKVAVIDSGVDIENQAIMQQVLAGFSFERDPKRNIIIESSDYNDIYGHGTNCIDYILQLADNTNFYSIKIVNECGKTTTDLLIHALNKCKELPVDIICLSLSVTVEIDFSNESKLHKVCNELNEKGILICASDCNNIRDTMPAIFESVIGVKEGCINAKNRISVNRYEKVQIQADISPVFVAGKSGRYNFFKGTSKANVYIAGLLAGFMQQGKKFGNIEDALNELEKIKEAPIVLDEKKLGQLPADELGRNILSDIQKILIKFGCTSKIEEICKYPFFSNITGITFFNFFDFIIEIYRELNITECDYHEIKIEDVCTLYNLVGHLRRKIGYEAEKYSLGTDKKI